MQLVLHKAGRKTPARLEVSDAVFAAAYNEALVHQVLSAFMSASRAGTKAQKNRAAVRGGGRKPWRQKGTGRARAGTIRSPLWRGGGVTFAARPRDHRLKVNKKMYRGAMRVILSELARQERLSAIDTVEFKAPKTRAASAMLKALGLTDVLLVTEEVSENLYLATRNLPRVDVIAMQALDPYRLLAFAHVLITQAAIEKVESWLS